MLCGVMVNIKLIRKKLGLSQKAFADAIGVDRITVWRWESGHTQPSEMAVRVVNHVLSLHDTKKKKR